MKQFLFKILLPFLIVSCNDAKIKVDPSDTYDLLDTCSLKTTVVKIGVAAMLTPQKTLPVYNELIHYIGKKMDVNVDMVFTKDYRSMNNMVKNKEVIAAFVCSGAYVNGKDEWGMKLIAAPVHEGETNYYSNIIVNKESNYKTLNDLEGRKFAFTDPESNTGKLVPSYELLKINKKPETFFSEIIYTGSHDNSIEAVAKNIVDGAAVDNLIWDYLNSNNSMFTHNTKIIQKIGPFSTPPLVTYPDMDTEVIDEIKEILLTMHTDLEGYRILKKIQIDKFVLIPDSAYNSIREMKRWIESN